jgi:hypothetical protein
MVLYGYSGSLAAAAVLFTVVNIWLYTRTCQIVPIIAAHLAYNLITSFGDPAWARDDHLTHGHRPLGLQHHRDPPPR